MTQNEKKVREERNNLNDIIQNMKSESFKDLEEIKEYTKKLANNIGLRFNTDSGLNDKNYKLMTAALNKILLLLPLMYMNAKSKQDIDVIKKYINIVDMEIVYNKYKIEGPTIFKLVTLNKEYGFKTSDVVSKITENITDRINNLKNDDIYIEFMCNEYNKIFVDNYMDIQNVFLNVEHAGGKNDEFIEKYTKMLVGLINFIFLEKYNDIDINDKDYII